MEKYIAVEKMLFGDYRVQVWDSNNDSCLDREYFCRGKESAVLTAFEIQRSLFGGLPIYIYSDTGYKTLISEGWE